MAEILVKSSMIHSVEYVEPTHTLTVTYISKAGMAKYEYEKVPKQVFDELMKAKSVGSFVAKEIKGKYQFKKVEQKVEDKK
jgi:hypothetical protein